MVSPHSPLSPFLYLGHWPIGINFFLWCAFMVQLRFFACEQQLSQHRLLKMAIFFIDGPQYPCQNNLTMDVWVYCWTLSCIPLILLSVLRPVLGFPGGSVIKHLLASAGDSASTPGSERSPGGENGNPLQNSWLENPMDRGGWWATVHWVTKELGMT